MLFGLVEVDMVYQCADIHHILPLEFIGTVRFSWPLLVLPDKVIFRVW